jgi:hypothetical protein
LHVLYKMWCKYFVTCIILVAAKGLRHLGSLFHHNTQYSQGGWYITNLLFCDIPQNKVTRTDPRHIWRTVPFLWPWEEHRWQSIWVNFTGHCLLWLLLLMLAAVVPLLLLSQNSLLTSQAFAPDSEAVSAARISLMASSSSFIYFFLAIAWDPQSSALLRLLCMTRHSFRNVIPVRYDHLL